MAAPPDPAAPPLEQVADGGANASARGTVASGRPSLYDQFAAYVTDRANQPKSLPVVFVLLLVPIVLALLAAGYVGGAHRVLDDTLVAADGGVDLVTAMAWSTSADGPLFIGTAGGTPLRIDRDGAVARGADAGMMPPSPAGAIAEILVPAGGAARPLLVARDTSGPAARLLIGAIETAPHLAVATADGRTILAARAAPFPDAKAQQAAPIMTANGRGLSQWIADGGGYAEAGEVFGIEDVRAIAMLPGRSMAVAGDGAGGVFAIDASRQISGVDPTEYVARLGSHGAAIVAIAAARGPAADGGADFVTAAADGSLKAWWISQPQNGSFSVATVARSAEIGTPGSRWRASATITGAGWRSLDGMSDDGSRILLTAADGHLVVARLPDSPLGTGETPPTIDLPSGLSAPAALSGDGRVVAAFNEGAGSVDMHFADSGTPSHRFADFRLPMRAIALDPAGGILAVLSEDGTAALVGTDTGERMPSPAGSGQPWKAVFGPDGSSLALISVNGAVSVHRVSDGTVLGLLPAETESAAYPLLAFRPSGNALVAFNSLAGIFYDYSLRGRRLAETAVLGRLNWNATALSGDGSRFVGISGSDFRVVDAATGAELAEATLPEADFVLANRDGSRIAILDRSGNLSVLLEETDETRFGAPPILAEDGLRLSADGTVLLLRDTAGRLYRAALAGEGERVRLASIPADEPVIEAELAPDGRSVVVAEADGTIEWIDLATGGAVPVLGHGDLVQAMAISPDGAYLASASLDGRLRITDLSRAGRVAALPLSGLRAGPPPARIPPRLLAPRTLDADAIAEVQSRLVAAGYGPMPVDGILGAATRRAILQWQADNGEAATGEITDELRRRLEATARPATARDMPTAE